METAGGSVEVGIDSYAINMPNVKTGASHRSSSSSAITPSRRRMLATITSTGVMIGRHCSKKSPTGRLTIRQTWALTKSSTR
jgi:hypothetical protein